MPYDFPPCPFVTHYPIAPARPSWLAVAIIDLVYGY